MSSGIDRVEFGLVAVCGWQIHGADGGEAGGCVQRVEWKSDLLVPAVRVGPLREEWKPDLLVHAVRVGGQTVEWRPNLLIHAVRVGLLREEGSHDDTILDVRS